MRRLLGRRTVSLWLAAVFPLVSGGTLVAGHGCPHHDGSGGPDGAWGHVAAAPSDAGPGHDADVGHGGSPDHSDGHPDFCTCVGDCHAGAAVPHLAASATFRATPVVLEGPERPLHREHVRVPIPYALPFANAPPTV